MEQTLVIIKPDALQRRLVGRIVERLERKGLKLVAMKMVRLDRRTGERHYDEHKGKPFYEPLLRFITSAPVILAVVQAPGAVQIVRKLTGATFGTEAEAGTIRGDMAVSNRYNLVHASDSPESAKKEIALFFNAEEILEYTSADETWVSELAPSAQK